MSIRNIDLRTEVIGMYNEQIYLPNLRLRSQYQKDICAHPFHIGACVYKIEDSLRNSTVFTGINNNKTNMAT